MKFKLLGKTGLKVSELCLGTMSFGGETSKVEAKRLYLASRKIGINFIDCANSYNQGTAETILGQLIKNDRNNLIITSKVSNPMSTDINNKGGSRRHINLAVNESLKRLKTDRIDILFMHRWDSDTRIDETLRGLENIIKSGKALYLGASNYTAWQIAKSLGISSCRNWVQFDVVQPMYNLVKRQAEVEILPLAKEENLGVMSYSPVAGGLLSGKYTSKEQSAKSRLRINSIYSKRYGENWMFNVAKNFKSLADKMNVHPVTLSVAWVAFNKVVTTPIIGGRNLMQLKESLKAIDFKMTPDLYKEICLLAPDPPIATDRLEEKN